MDLSACSRETPEFTLLGIAAPAKVVSVGPGSTIEVAFDTPGFGLRRHAAHIGHSKARSLKTSWQLTDLLLGNIYNMRVTAIALNGDLIIKLFDRATGEDAIQDNLPEPGLSARIDSPLSNPKRKASCHPDGPFSASSFAD